MSKVGNVDGSERLGVSRLRAKLAAFFIKGCECQGGNTVQCKVRRAKRLTSV